MYALGPAAVYSCFCAISAFALLLFASSAEATPITVGGFTFSAGEAAFADDANVISGTVTGASIETVAQVLAGSNMGDSIRVITPDVAVIEILFTDNAIRNGAGTDLVIFELSGAGFPVGQGDAQERFEFSVFDGTGFSPLVEVVPVNTGTLSPHDPTLAVYAVEIDLQNFGFASGQITSRVRIRLVDNLTGTRSADPTGLGALNSISVPEPSVLPLLVCALAWLARRRCSARCWN